MVQDRHEFIEGFLAAMTLTNSSLFPKNEHESAQDTQRNILSRTQRLCREQRVCFEKLLDVPTFIRRGKRVKI